MKATVTSFDKRHSHTKYYVSVTKKVASVVVISISQKIASRRRFCSLLVELIQFSSNKFGYLAPEITHTLFSLFPLQIYEIQVEDGDRKHMIYRR